MVKLSPFVDFVGPDDGVKGNDVGYEFAGCGVGGDGVVREDPTYVVKTGIRVRVEKQSKQFFAESSTMGMFDR
ncbi:unnamed protein product [Linum trigynum]|uniref:Uncharacterized protein n=1 Tax=Linum trigynum TaxID=586398 RepID=A0AAV2CDQ5_9ROSI